MPRAARIKGYDSIYHVMVRSISDSIRVRFNEGKTNEFDLHVFGE